MTIIGISGKKQSGKDEVFRIIKKHQPTAVRIAFADEVKREVAQATNCTIEYMEAHKDVFRTIYQWWGTDFRRNLCNPDYWCDCWLDTIHKLQHDAIVVTPDIRFLNEVELFHDMGQPVWRINRGLIITDTHASETELDNYEFPLTINNNGTLAKLETRVLQLLETVI